jgi:predicted chitinase
MINPSKRERRVWTRRPPQRRDPEIPAQHLTRDRKHLCDNFWQTISQAARDRNAAIEKQAQRKNQYCTTLAAIHAGDVTKIRMRVLKKIQGGKKNWRVCISSG